ncbi:hypothetical protein GGR53DRAFT_502021 [Hypoxylon sp. FL1150]|nr:hypothetical protein GGR53DRAFT_502021 [Hypoxylon sp. FL1150]
MSRVFKDSSSYLARLQSFNRVDKERDELIKELIANCQAFQDRLEQKCNEYDKLEAQVRSVYQAQADEANGKLADIQRKADANSFAFAVIDGDEAIFRDGLVSKGEKSGLVAANRLQADIRKHLRSIYPDVNSEDWRIIVQVALNLEGLSKADHTKRMAKINEFARGFNHARAFFSLVDVGKDMQQSYVKVREMARLMLPNPQCKQVIIGPCYDKHYILQLQSLLFDPKVALFETSQTTREAQDSGYRMFRFPEVFRSDVPNGNASSSSPLRNGMVDIIEEFKNSLDLKGTQSLATPRKCYLVNASGERVDEPAPNYETSAAQRVDARVKEEARGPCYRYHLAGACGVSSCSYYHNGRLGLAEQQVLRARARNFLCSYRSACNNPDCIWGHHCRYGSKCQISNCSYGDTHDIDTTPVERIYENGLRERIRA